MIVACSTLCFGKLPLDEALRVIREMRFAKADLAIHEPGPHLRPSEVAADVGRVAQRLKASNLAFAAFHVAFDSDEGPTTRDQLRAICRLARVLAVPILTVLPSSRLSDLDGEVERLKEWGRIAESDGLILAVETKADSITADPAQTIELCKRVPGLGLTLDPSHFHIAPAGPIDYDPLYPYVRHLRLRDTGKKPEEFQVRVGLGDLEYGRIVTQLERFRYDRALTVDVRDVPDNAFPVEPEVRKLKYLLESLV